MHGPVEITSLQNPQIKKLVKLRDKKWRKKLEEFLVEGAREQKRALANGFECLEVYFCPNLLSPQAQEILNSLSLSLPHFELNESCFEKIAVRDDSDGLVLVMKTEECTLSDIKVSDKPFLLMAENIEKPGNLGGLFRSADGVGADALLTIGTTVDIYNPHVIRASLGTCFSVQTASCSKEEAFDFCKKNKAPIFAAFLADNTVSYTSVDYQNGAALLVGSEDKGLESFWKTKANQSVSIPMNGDADSLNVSVAGAVLLL